ncbi:DUF5994 family protein [Flexivirga sp. B27]
MTAAPVAPSVTTIRWSLSGTRGTGPSDGAWWPHSTDLGAEIADLDVAVHDHFHERIARVSYTQGQWPPAPRKIHTTLGITKLGWFTHARYPENIILSLTGYTRLVLTVIPSDTDTHFAKIVLAGYGTVINDPTEAPDNAAASPEETGAWDNEGGHPDTRSTARYGHPFN